MPTRTLPKIDRDIHADGNVTCNECLNLTYVDDATYYRGRYYCPNCVELLGIREGDLDW